MPGVTTRSVSAILPPTSLLRPVYAFSPNTYCSCANIPLQNIAREKSNLDHLLHVRIPSSHHTTHSLISLQSHATRPSAGHRRPPIHAIPMVQRSQPTRDLQQPAFCRLSKLLRFSPRMNAVRPGRKDQSRDPLDACLFSCFFYSSLNTRATVPCYITLTLQSHSWRKHSIDFLARWQRLFQSHSVLVRQGEAKGA
jgi:hypothetical protein